MYRINKNVLNEAKKHFMDAPDVRAARFIDILFQDGDIQNLKKSEFVIDALLTLRALAPTHLFNDMYDMHRRYVDEDITLNELLNSEVQRLDPKRSSLYYEAE